MERLITAGRPRLGPAVARLVAALGGLLLLACGGVGQQAGAEDEHVELRLGYLVNLTRDQLERAPKYSDDRDWSWTRENLDLGRPSQVALVFSSTSPSTWEEPPET